ncbi:uncharacterized protein LOC114529343 isoform X2 [Dendronephthya gigantea]|uniref:uncharacterized protein LOC114529343 isoform X2 n=1 Tax=Dendronephthya gigantea TaxID=151771 RepID=UPI0010691719|nr:uncharacterized protein LOC114529343 isoform X2 [Dendronephthya gigantea]
MTLFWHQIATLAAFKVIFLLSLLPDPAFSELDLIRSGEPKIILLTNKSFEFQCTATGTRSELAGVTITWEGPDGKGIPGNDDKGNITSKDGTGSVTSILRVSKPPGYLGDQPGVKFYQCALEKSSKQLNYHVYFVEEEAVPKIHPIQLNQTKFKETVLLKCDASYKNQNYRIADKFTVILQWKKGGKTLANKVFEYETGKNTSTLEHSFAVNSFRDGGDYVCQSQLMLESEADNITSSKIVELQILPYLNGPIEKEVKDTAGSDVSLHCDVVGYPITYEWRDEENCLIGVEKKCTESRIRPRENVLYIDDIDYKDRKKYTCVGSFRGNSTLKQFIILRVKDPLAALWPFIGILVEAVLVAAIILASEYYKKHSQNGANTKTEMVEQPTTSHDA